MLRVNNLTGFGAGGGGGTSIILVDSMTFTHDGDGAANLSVTISGMTFTTGDLMIISFSFGSGADATWSWGGDVTITDIYDQTGSGTPGAYAGYGTLTSGDATVSVSGVTFSGWSATSGVISVWRNAAYGGVTSDTGASGMPDPPSHSGFVAGDVSLAIGMLDDDDVTATAQSGYTLIDALGHTVAGPTRSSHMQSYKEIIAAGADDPAAFGGVGTDAWKALTVELNEA